MVAYRYFQTYSGVKLPVRLVNPLSAEDVANRNTYIRALYDEQDRLVDFEKVVYGEVELMHCYRYHESGTLQSAEIVMGGERRILKFDP